MTHPSPRRSVFVTGATSGFGAAIARKFAHDGWAVIMTGRREDRLKTMAEELSALTDVHTIALDVQDKHAVMSAVEALPDPFKDVHTLVNNAGLALGLDKSQSANLDDWDTMVDTNIKGLLYVTRALLPTLIRVGGGTVINIGSIAGTYPYPGGNTYGGTKAFVKQFSLNLRNDLAGTGVRVTNIEPGMAETEFSVVRFDGDKAKADAVYAGAKPLVANDIADTALWVANSPKHVNYNAIEVMPVCQSFAPFAIHREDA